MFQIESLNVSIENDRTLIKGYKFSENEFKEKIFLFLNNHNEIYQNLKY